MFWMGLGTVVAKSSSLISLFVLGWFLSKEEFAIYALALSSSIIFCALRNGGLQQIIIQRGERGYNLAIGIYFKYALLVNLVGMLLIFMISPAVVKVFENDVLYYVLAIIGLSLPMSTSGTLYKLKLVTQLKFSDVAKFDMYSSLVRHGAAVLFCVIGFGVFSFVLPLLGVAVFEHLYGKYKTGVKLLSASKLSLYKFNKIFSNAKWMVLATIFISISLQGDYFVVGIFESEVIVGVYFFGFQIIASVVTIASQGMQTVILPIITKFKSDMERQANAYVKMLVVLTTTITLIALQIYLFTPYVINFLWNGKWDDAIPVIQIMSISLVTWLLVPMAKSVLESKGQWKVVSFIMVADAIGIIAAAVIGAVIGGLFEITLFVSMFRLLYGCLCAVYVAGLLFVQRKEILKIIFAIMLCAFIALYCTFQVIEFMKLQSFIAVALTNIIFSSSMYLLLLYVFQKSTLVNTVNYFQSLLAKSNG